MENNSGSINLSRLLDSTYKPVNRSDSVFKGTNFNRDKDLSNINQRLYVDNTNKKAVATFRGTHNLANDLGSDLDIFFGTKNVFGNRLKESEKFYKNIKQKYPNHELTLTGHSLGGHLASKVSKNSNDKIVTFNKGAGLLTPFEKTKKNERSYRTPTDVVSLLSSGHRNTRTTGRFDANLLNTHGTKALNKKINIRFN